MKELKQELKPFGRPSADTEALTLRLRRNVIAKIDDWRRIQPDIPVRQEAIRRILEKALGK